MATMASNTSSNSGMRYFPFSNDSKLVYAAFLSNRTLGPHLLAISEKLNQALNDVWPSYNHIEYVQIANRVFKITVDPSLPDICFLAYLPIARDLSKMLCVQSAEEFDLSAPVGYPVQTYIPNGNRLFSIQITIMPHSKVNAEDPSHTLLISDIKNIFYDTFSNQFLAPNQEIDLVINKRIWSTTISFNHPLDFDVGLFTRETAISVTASNASQNPILIGETIKTAKPFLSIAIEKNGSSSSNPIHLTIKELKKHLYEHWKDKCISPGQKMHLEKDSTKIALTLNFFTDLVSHSKYCNTHNAPQYGLKIHENSTIQFEVQPNSGVYLAEEESVNATAIALKIENIEAFTEKAIYHHHHLRFFADEIKAEFVATCKSECWNKQKFTLFANDQLGFSYELTLVVTGGTSTDRRYLNSLFTICPKWKINRNTEIHLVMSESLKATLADSEELFPCKKLGILVNLLQGFNIPTLISHEKLETLLKRNLKQCVKGDVFVLEDGFDIFEFKILKAKSDSKKQKEIQYGNPLLEILDSTKLEFKPGEGKEIIIQNTRSVHLEKLGCVGLSSKVINRLEEVRDNFCDIRKFARMGIPPQNCMLIHGKQGTGKSLLANALFSYLRLDTKLVLSGKEINPSFINSIENILDITYDTIIKEVKHKHLIIIDGIEHLESEKNIALTNALTLFIDKAKRDKVYNFFIVITTEQAKNLDLALLDPARIPVSIELTLPNEESRKRIFGFYLKKLIKKRKAVPDIDLSILASKSKGLTASQIASLQLPALNIARKKSRDKLAGTEDFVEAIENLMAIRPDDPYDHFIFT